MDDEGVLLKKVPNGLFIGGSWRPSASGQTFAVNDPATGSVIAHVADASPADGMAALEAASNAFAHWSRTPPRRRADVLRAAFDRLTDRREEFALLITLEMGKPLEDARREVAYGAEFLRWFSEEAARVSGRYGSSPEGTGRMIVSQHPVGPCLAITPWNFPLAMATRKLAPALAAGCTVVVKPAELTPLTTLFFAQLLHEAGVPDGVVNVIPTTDAAAVCEPVIADSRLRKLSFTGSTPVGQRLLAQASQGVLRTSMELGGNAPFIVFDDADLVAAVDGAIAAKFRNMGQACTAANRFIVHESVIESFVSAVHERVSAMTLGRGTDAGVTLGPLIDERAVSKATELVDDAVARGAAALVGGSAIEGPGSFFPPTVLTGVTTDARLLREEIFGPVVAVVSFADEDEAVRLANATEYGLVAYVFTRDLARAQRMMERLETGMLGVNTGLISNAAAPFGGWKASGIGREGGAEGIQEYLQTKYTLTANPFS